MYLSTSTNVLGPSPDESRLMIMAVMYNPAHVCIMQRDTDVCVRRQYKYGVQKKDNKPLVYTSPIPAMRPSYLYNCKILFIIIIIGFGKLIIYNVGVTLWAG